MLKVLAVKLAMWLVLRENTSYLQAAGSPLGGAKKERKTAGAEELQFDMLIPLKNHPEGLECFSYSVVHYTMASEPAPRKSSWRH